MSLEWWNLLLITRIQSFNMKKVTKDDLVAGRWYYTAYLDYYFKFRDKEEHDGYTSITSTKYIQEGRAHTKVDSFSNTNMLEGMVEADMDSVLSHFPDEVIQDPQPVINNSYSII